VRRERAVEAAAEEHAGREFQRAERCSGDAAGDDVTGAAAPDSRREMSAA
jgi:hypothetical protein